MFGDTAAAAVVVVGNDANSVPATAIAFVDAHLLRVTLQAACEIVLTASVHSSTQLLMLSGLCPEEYLREHGLLFMLHSVYVRDFMSIH